MGFLERNAHRIEHSKGGCLVWTAQRCPDGYGKIQVEGRPHGAHRVSWACVNGPIPDGLLVLHRCDNPACVNPDHLFTGTQADNVRDRQAKGRTARGSRSGTAKLTEEKVRLLREHRKDGATVECLAAAFGVAQPTIYAVLSGRNWGHIK